MSDDEYFYDSPYEDVYDLLWDADPAPELADDLAERAVYSPIWQHTHTGELKDYFSDWDEHSDDYWDDDPKLLNDGNANRKSSQPIDVNPPKPTKRGRKRKLSEARDGPSVTQQNIEILQATLRGTVWKRKSPELDNDYRKGSDKPTALRLSDSIMRSAYNKTQGFGRGGLKRDESWANDLSLADMGLTTEVTSIEQPDGAMDEEEEEEEVEDKSESNSRIGDLHVEEDIMASSGSGRTGEYPTMGDHVEVYKTMMLTDPNTTTDIPDEEQISCKKRKVTATANAAGRKDNGRSSLERSVTSTVARTNAKMDDIVTSKSRKRARDGSQKNARHASSQEVPMKEDQEDKGMNGHRGHKRKLSPDTSATASTASSRAKRAATDTNLPQAKPAIRETRAGRATRSRKA